MYKFATWEKRAVIFKMPSEAWMLVPHAIAPYWERCNVAHAFTKASALTEKQFRAMFPTRRRFPTFRLVAAHGGRNTFMRGLCRGFHGQRPSRGYFIPAA